MASKLPSVQQQMVGIFWLVGGRLILDASPLTACGESPDTCL